MSNQNDLLASIAISVGFDNNSKELDESIGSISLPRRRREGRSATAGKIDGQARSKVGKTD